MNGRVLVASVALLLLLPACATMKTNERSRKITVLAAREAANITDADTRLTLQLNIANGALARFQADDGMAIISEVVRTLRSERERLRGRTRLSGWVSASQLSRLANNPAAAAEATRAAAQELVGLADVATEVAVTDVLDVDGGLFAVVTDENVADGLLAGGEDGDRVIRTPRANLAAGKFPLQGGAKDVTDHHAGETM
jgi:hypothetical protein